ncbi:MAG TPA: SDR family NAD(P)-dependent oxidoreductase [Candidatus Thermoplasmatota archaeon]|jgi:NAD(P)-dependent dehydrogenase (short-subunit alcohol dehydrogenase family)|nr:SDR family NAD(P)-dependent oxidoreductase [Candidatus Thermoplasmatota archaeon]
MMEGRVCLVTGATSGIGLAAARALAAQGARVLLGARSRERGEAAIAAIKAATPGAAVDLFVADLAQQREVRRLAADVRARHRELDVLVNNAGAVLGQRQRTEDGLEHTLALNHLAPFLLTHLLLDPLRAAAPARVVTVASEAHRYGPGRFDFRGERPHNPWWAYADSKLGNILFTRALAKRLDPRELTANCMHPGVVRTNFGMSGGLMVGGAMRLARPFLRSPERGADTAVWLASAPEVDGQTGGYYKDRRLRQPSPRARDDALAEQVWQQSAKLTGAA